jgi:hypothetical protein
VRSAISGSGKQHTSEGVEADRAEVAALVGQQRKLAAGVGGFERPARRCRVGAVHRVQEDHARVSALPRRFGDSLQKSRGIHALRHLAVARVDQVEGLATERGAPEGVCGGHGEIEVGDAIGAALRVHEGADVGVIDAQHTHVRAAAPATLHHRRRSGVEDLEKGNGARRHAAAAPHAVTGGPQPR